MIKTLNTLFVTMFGLGKIKIIPGTFSSLATVMILYICFHILNISTNLILIGLIFIILIYTVFGVQPDNYNVPNNMSIPENSLQTTP